MKIVTFFLLLILPLACFTNSGVDSGVSAPVRYEMEQGKVSQINALVAVEDTEFANQKLIKESYLSFETNNLNKTYGSIMSFVKVNRGFVQNDNASKSYDRQSRNLTIRIPTENFQKTIDSISTIVNYFDTKQVSLRDVTEEFIDVEARLKAKFELEKRYLELLSKANTVKEMIEIERELSNIREEIESRQGRLKYLNDKVSLSTLNVEFYKITAETGVTTSYGRKMWNALRSGFNALSVFFLGLINIWPFIIIILIAVYFIRKQLRNRKK